MTNLEHSTNSTTNSLGTSGELASWLRSSATLAALKVSRAASIGEGVVFW